MDGLKKIAAEEGVGKGLCKGFVANFLRSIGGALVYDHFSGILQL